LDGIDIQLQYWFQKQNGSKNRKVVIHYPLPWCIDNHWIGSFLKRRKDMIRLITNRKTIGIEGLYRTFDVFFGGKKIGLATEDPWGISTNLKNEVINNVISNIIESS
jgi:hypothetical protein